MNQSNRRLHHRAQGPHHPAHFCILFPNSPRFIYTNEGFLNGKMHKLIPSRWAGSALECCLSVQNVSENQRKAAKKTDRNAAGTNGNRSDVCNTHRRVGGRTHLRFSGWMGSHRRHPPRRSTRSCTRTRGRSPLTSMPAL